MKLILPVSLVLAVAVLGWLLPRQTPGCELKDKTRLSFYITFERLEPAQGEPKSVILRLHNNTSCLVMLEGEESDGNQAFYPSGFIADGSFAPRLYRYDGMQITLDRIALPRLDAAPRPAGRVLDVVSRGVWLKGGYSLLFDVSLEDLRQRRGIVLTPRFVWEQQYDAAQNTARDESGALHAAYFAYRDFPESVQAAIGFSQLPAR